MIGALLFLAVVVVSGVVAGRLAQRRPAIRPFKWRPMELIVGAPGTGKSYTLTYRAIRSLAHGRSVRLNFRLRPERVFVALRLRYYLSEAEAREAVGRISYFQTFEDYVDAYDLDAYVDEAQDTYRSTDWNILPAEFITWNAQHRHRRCTITLACHRFGSIHNYVREGLIARVLLATPGGKLGRLVRRIKGQGNLPLLRMEEIKDQYDEVLPSAHQRGRGLARLFRRESIPLDPVIANCYDTEGGVLMSPLDRIRREKAKGQVIELGERGYRRAASQPLDGLPFLTDDDMTACKDEGLEPWKRLFAAFQDSGVSLDSLRPVTTS